MRLDLACPALCATFHTSDPAVASRWLASVLRSCPAGASVSVQVNGRERGARIAARIMGLSEQAIINAIQLEAA